MQTTYEITTRNAGHKSQYSILRVFLPGRETPTVHTRKGPYGATELSKLRQERWPEAVRKSK